MTTTQKKEAKKPEKVKVIPVEVNEEHVAQPGTGQAVVVSDGQPVVPQDFKTKLTRKQIDTIKEQFAKGASDVELQMFLYVCQRTQLDPFSKQVHLVPRWDSKLGKDVRVVVVGIDGLRSTAERTGAYAGNSDPEFGDEKEIEVTKKDYRTKQESVTRAMVPSRATVTVKKVVQGIVCDFTATAKWEEYYPGDRQGVMWLKMPENMLGKCAEAKALRKAFPAVMGGIYVPEEMHQAGSAESLGAGQSDFDKAKAMIAKVNDPVGLGEFKAKIEGSKKYSDKEKTDLVVAVDDRLQEITVGSQHSAS